MGYCNAPPSQHRRSTHGVWWSVNGMLAPKFTLPTILLRNRLWMSIWSSARSDNCLYSNCSLDSPLRLSRCAVSKRLLNPVLDDARRPQWIERNALAVHGIFSSLTLKGYIVGNHYNTGKSIRCLRWTHIKVRYILIKVSYGLILITSAHYCSKNLSSCRWTHSILGMRWQIQ